MKAIKLIFAAAVFVAMSLGAQAQNGPTNTKFGTKTDHIEYRSDSPDDSETAANQTRREVYEKGEIPFYARFVSAVFRWRLF